MGVTLDGFLIIKKHSNSSSWFVRILKYKHCIIILKTKYGYKYFDFQKNRIIKIKFPDIDVEFLKKFYSEGRITPFSRRNFLQKKIQNPNCVYLSCRLIGVKYNFLLTPYLLFLIICIQNCMARQFYSV